MLDWYVILDRLTERGCNYKSSKFIGLTWQTVSQCSGASKRVVKSTSCIEQLVKSA